MKSKTFKLSGTMIFEAKNLDDALTRLSKYFKGLIEGEENVEIEVETDITLEPLKKTKTKGGEK